VNKSIEELKKKLQETLKKKEEMEKELKYTSDKAESNISKFYAL
jgi:predicted nuclease with TOPRIM domain